MSGGIGPGIRGAARAILAAGILAAPWIPRAHAGPQQPASVPPAGAEARQPAPTLNLDQAYASAEQLVGSRWRLESLPYFRRMIEVLPEDDWSLHHDYANALQGASMQARTLLGLPLELREHRAPGRGGPR